MRTKATPPHLMSTIRSSHASRAVATVTLLAFGLRLIRLEWQSLWFDEGWSWYIAARSWQRMAQLLAIDNHPPLYYALLKLWMALAGDSDLAMRFLSVLAGTATVPLAYTLGRRLLGSHTIAGVAALFVAISPPHVLYSQELRMYSWAVLLGGFAIYLALGWIEQHNWKTFAGYILTTVAALYTSYFSVLAIASANVIVLLTAVLRKQPRALRSWAIAQVAALLSLLPLRPLIVNLSTHTYVWRPTLDWKAILVDAWWSLTTGDTLPTWHHTIWVPVALVVLIVGWLYIFGQSQGGQRALLAGLYLAVPIGLMMGLAQWRPVYAGRYLLHALLPLALLAGAGCTAISHSATNLISRLPLKPPVVTALGLLPAFLLCGLGFALPFEHALSAYYFDPTYAREDFRALSTHIGSQEKPGQVLVLLNSAYPFLRYYRGHLPHVILPTDFDHVKDEDEVIAVLNQLITPPSWVWLVGWQWDAADPQNLIESQLRQHGSEVGQQWWWNKGPKPPVRISAYDIVSGKFEKERYYPLDVSFGTGEIRLIGYNIHGVAKPGQRVFLTLWWELQAVPAVQYHAFAHLLSYQTWPPVVAGHDKPPLNDFYPFHVWPLHQAVHDVYTLELPTSSPPPPYELEVGLYDPADGARLTATENGQVLGDRVVLPLDRP